MCVRTRVSAPPYISSNYLHPHPSIVPTGVVPTGVVPTGAVPTGACVRQVLDKHLLERLFDPYLIPI